MAAAIASPQRKSLMFGAYPMRRWQNPGGSDGPPRTVAASLLGYRPMDHYGEVTLNEHTRRAGRISRPDTGESLSGRRLRRPTAAPAGRRPAVPGRRPAAGR